MLIISTPATIHVGTTEPGRRGPTILLVEQNLCGALTIADRADARTERRATPNPS